MARVLRSVVQQRLQPVSCIIFFSDLVLVVRLPSHHGVAAPMVAVFALISAASAWFAGRQWQAKLTEHGRPTSVPPGPESTTESGSSRPAKRPPMTSTTSGSSTVARPRQLWSPRAGSRVSRGAPRSGPDWNRASPSKRSSQPNRLRIGRPALSTGVTAEKILSRFLSRAVSPRPVPRGNSRRRPRRPTGPSCPRSVCLPDRASLASLRLSLRAVVAMDAEPIRMLDVQQQSCSPAMYPWICSTMER